MPLKLRKRLRKIRRRLKRYTLTNRIVSLGGVGSSSLVAHVENGDPDRIWYHSRDKHCLHPELIPEVRRGLTVRVCFLFGDPYPAVLSLFRRGLHRRHEQAMSRNKRGYRVALEHDTTLEEYLAGGVDRFFLREHLDNWIGYGGGSAEVLAVKYEALGEHIRTVLDFLHCSRPFQVRPRVSRLEEQPESVRRGLEKVYGELKAHVDALPSLIHIGRP